jgi:hypothetical protein
MARADPDTHVAAVRCFLAAGAKLLKWWCAGQNETENSYVIVAARHFQTQGKRGRKVQRL